MEDHIDEPNVLRFSESLTSEEEVLGIGHKPNILHGSELEFRAERLVVLLIREVVSEELRVPSDAIESGICHHVSKLLSVLLQSLSAEDTKLERLVSSWNGSFSLDSSEWSSAESKEVWSDLLGGVEDTDLAAFFESGSDLSPMLNRFESLVCLRSTDETFLLGTRVGGSCPISWNKGG